MDASDPQIEAAEQRMKDLLESGPHAVSARYDRRVSRIMVALSNGLGLAFSPHLAEGLADATAASLSVVEITPTGLGLHWPKLDADSYVPALLKGVFGSPAWMARSTERNKARGLLARRSHSEVLKPRTSVG